MDITQSTRQRRYHQRPPLFSTSQNVWGSNPMGEIFRCGLWEEFRELITVPGNLEAAAVD